MQALVLGGGAAGLASAIAIRQAGWRCLVLETRTRGEPSARDVHVHRLSAAGRALLQAAAPEASAPSLVTLGAVETRLADAARSRAVEIRFGTGASQVEVEAGRWCIRDSDGAVHGADLLIDATGGRRASLGLIEGVIPDIAMDDLGGGESFVSWTGSAPQGREELRVWADPASGLDGLVQIGPGRRSSLTCRYTSGDPAPLLDDIADPVRRATDLDVGSLGFEGRGVRYTAPGVQRIALDEVDLAHLPPLALVGDALLLAPPRFGEGLQRALEQARTVCETLSCGQTSALGARLARDARGAWSGNGLAMAMRATS